jgi:signal transduction histidine kinase
MAPSLRAHWVTWRAPILVGVKLMKAKRRRPRGRAPTLGRKGILAIEGRLRNALRRLSRKLFRLQDNERRHLARELHDTTAQNIAAMIMDLGVISGSKETLRAEARTALSDCISLARESLQEIRAFSHLLHPPMIDELGLLSAFRVYVEGFSRRSGMRVDLELPDPYTRLSDGLEVTLFHVVREGLTNAHRHSGSSWAKVRMRVDAMEIGMSVENETINGALRRKSSVPPMKMGVGLRSMHERVRHFGGKVVFHLERNRTILEAIFPLSRAAKRQAPKGVEPQRVLRKSGLTQQAG